MTEHETGQVKLTTIEVACLGVACACEAAFVAVLAFVRPEMERMFADFGGSLPVPTQWMLDDAVPWTLAALPSLFMVAGFVVARRRLPFFIASMAVAIFALLAFLVAMYLPLFIIAGNIR